MSNKGHRVSRRKVVKGMFAAAVAGSVGDAMAQTNPATPTSAPVTRPSNPTTSPSPATTKASDVTIDDLAVVDRVHGFHYSDADHKLMAEDVVSQRTKLIALRKRTIDPRIEPAV